MGGFRKGPFEMLEPDEGKLSSPVLRGPGRSNPARLPDPSRIVDIMKQTKDWHRIIASDSHLSPDAARQMRDIGFVVLAGPVIPGGCEQLTRAYDRAVATADSSDVHTGRTGASTRINNFVNRGPEFDNIYIYPPLLAACSQVIGGTFNIR